MNNSGESDRATEQSQRASAATPAAGEEGNVLDDLGG
jgi:hypothetical protein